MYSGTCVKNGQLGTSQKCPDYQGALAGQLYVAMYQRDTLRPQHHNFLKLLVNIEISM